MASVHLERDQLIIYVKHNFIRRMNYPTNQIKETLLSPSGDRRRSIVLGHIPLLTSLSREGDNRR
jgi:hypothetical protein